MPQFRVCACVYGCAFRCEWQHFEEAATGTHNRGCGPLARAPPALAPTGPGQPSDIATEGLMPVAGNMAGNTYREARMRGRISCHEAGPTLTLEHCSQNINDKPETQPQPWNGAVDRSPRPPQCCSPRPPHSALLKPSAPVARRPLLGMSGGGYAKERCEPAACGLAGVATSAIHVVNAALGSLLGLLDGLAQRTSIAQQPRSFKLVAEPAARLHLIVSQYKILQPTR